MSQNNRSHVHEAFRENNREHGRLTAWNVTNRSFMGMTCRPPFIHKISNLETRLGTKARSVPVFGNGVSDG